MPITKYMSMFKIVYPCSYLNLSIYTEYMNKVSILTVYQRTPDIAISEVSECLE